MNLTRRTDQPPEPREEWLPALEPYLDGRLGDEACAAVRRALAGDPELRAAHDASRDIDRSIVRLLGMPARLGASPRSVESCGMPSQPSGPQAPLEPAAPVRRSGARRWLTIVGAASAAAAAIAVAVAVIAPKSGRVGPVVEAATRDPATLYASLVQDGFVPSMKCEDDAEFARYTAEMYGESFLVPQSDRMRVIGWAYGREVAGMDAGIILCRVDDAPVVVLVGRRGADRPVDVPAASGLTAHRRELGEVVMYELTPHGSAEVIPAATLVDGVR